MSTRRKERPASREYPLGSPAGLRALASATRQEIVDVLTSSGPMPIAELGRLLGRRPDALYFHVRVLERAGLVVRHESQAARGRASAVFGVRGPIRLDYQHGSRRELARIVRLAMRLAQREFERACLAERPVDARRPRTMRGGRVMGWLSPTELARVDRLISEAVAILRQGRPGSGRQAISLGLLLAPAGFGDRVRKASKAPKEEKTKSAKSKKVKAKGKVR